MVNISKLSRRLPGGFDLLERGRILCIFKEGWKDAVLKCGEAAEGNFEVSHLSGRGRPRIISTPRGKVVSRHYHHGGLLRWFTGDLFPGASRPLEEVRLLEEARRRGVRVPEVIGLWIYRTRLGLVRADLITRYIADSMDLLNYYLAFPKMPAPGGVGSEREMIFETARMVRRMHDCGIYHADLQIKNILLQSAAGGWRVFVIDLDKAWRRSKLSRGLILKNLLRFYRSFQKIKLVKPALSPRIPLRFLRAYAPGEKALRKDILKKAMKYGWRIRLHRWRWKVSRVLGPDCYARPLRPRAVNKG